MSDREVMQQALEALEISAVTVDSFRVQKATQDAITTLKAALEQPKQEPLTDGEIYTAYITAANQTLRPQDERIAFAFARAIEAAHNIGEKT
jgi:hypothetical protein